MKNLVQKLALGGIAAALVSTAALAEPTEKETEKKPKKKPDLAARFVKLDKNTDGFVDAEELKAGMKKNPDGAAKLIKRKDKDGDGKLSKAEFTAVKKKKKPVADGPAADAPAAKSE